LQKSIKERIPGQTSFKKSLIEKIYAKDHVVGIIGLGYVGLPLALEFAGKGISTIGFDIDEKKIPILNAGDSYLKHVSGKRVAAAVSSGKFSAVSDFSLLANTDVIIIAVPTPLTDNREPDLSFVKNTAVMVADYLTPGQLIVLESSTYPGTTEEIILPLLEDSFKKKFGMNFSGRDASASVGRHFFLAFSPEREDPNNPDFTTATIPKLVGGITQACSEVACAVYDQVIVKTVPVSSAKVAEAAKLLENIYRAVNIALVNELKMVFAKMDIDIWEVIEAAKTKPFGYHPFYPGPGLGGHCIPIDPFYLTWKARQYDISTKFIELAGEINTYQPYYVVERCADALNGQGKSLKGTNILILGAAYKKDIDDMRESPSLKLISLLRSKGALVDYNDPYVPVLPPTRKFKFEMKSVELTAANLKKYDCVIVSTNHSIYDYQFISDNTRLIVDTRNAFSRVARFSNLYQS